MRKLFLLAMIAAGMTALAACNTVEGFGRDVGAAGDAIENTADDMN